MRGTQGDYYGDLFLLNEEGKLMGLPLNPEATALWRAHFPKEKFRHFANESAALIAAHFFFADDGYTIKKKI